MKVGPIPVILDIVEPMTLQKEEILLPCNFAFWSASKVSLVSPDWLTPIVSVLLLHTDSAEFTGSEGFDRYVREFPEEIHSDKRCISRTACNDVYSI